MKLIEIETSKGTLYLNPEQIIGIGEYEPTKWSIILSKEMAVSVTEDVKDYLLREIEMMR